MVYFDLCVFFYYGYFYMNKEVVFVWEFVVGGFYREIYRVWYLVKLELGYIGFFCYFDI